jgi:hypothetical protein
MRTNTVSQGRVMPVGMMCGLWALMGRMAQKMTLEIGKNSQF